MHTLEYSPTDWFPVILGGTDSHSIIYELIAHPDEAITIEELEYFTPDDTAVESELQDLIELGICREIGDEPFYGFTETGKQFIVDSGLYRGSSVLKNVFQRTEMTPTVREKFELERPEWYLEDIIHPEFEEREWVKNTEAWTEALDENRTTVRTTVIEADDKTGFTILVERNPSVPDGDDIGVLIVDRYTYSRDERNALKDEREPFTVESEQYEYDSNRESSSEYYSDVDISRLDSDNRFAPFITVKVMSRGKSTPVDSVSIEPNMDL